MHDKRTAARLGPLTVLCGVLGAGGCGGEASSDGNDPATPDGPEAAADTQTRTDSTKHLIGAGYQVRFELINMRATGPEDSVLQISGTVTDPSDDRDCMRVELDSGAPLTQFGQPVADDFTVDTRPPESGTDSEWTTHSADVLNEDGVRCVLGRRPRPPQTE